MDEIKRPPVSLEPKQIDRTPEAAIVAQIREAEKLLAEAEPGARYKTTLEHQLEALYRALEAN